MKRKIAFAALALAAAMSLAACSEPTVDTGDTSADTSAVSVSENAAEPSEITAKIIADIEMSSLAEVQSDRIEMYLDADMEKVDSFSMFICGSGGFADESNQRVSLSTNNDAIFDVSDTILVQGVKGYEGTRESKFDLVLYVVSKSEDGKLSAMAVNGQTVGDMENCIPTIAKDTVLIRMGRAATELDVQTPQFEALPQRASQYCQIFKAQVEQSVLHKMANKEIGWTLNDQGEAAEESK